jgi:hypothetical protein
MKPSNARVLSLLQSVLAIGLGVVALVIVNLPAASIVESLLPGSLDPDGMPLTAEAQVAFLPILFLAGMAAAFVVVFVAPRAPVGHAVVFGALAVLGDLVVVLEYAGIWPLWFSALVVATVPPQVWLGAVLGLRARRRWAPWARGATQIDAAASLPLVAPSRTGEGRL